jgi:hypothetical protein
MAYTATYGIGDLTSIGVDIAGAFMYGLFSQAAALAQIIVLTLIIGAIALLIGAVFGIIKIPRIGRR